MSDWASVEQFTAFASRFARVAAVLPVAKIRMLALLAILFWFLWLLADLVWMLVPAPTQSASVPAVAAIPEKTGTSAAPAIDVQQLQGWHLFGKAEEAVAAPEVKPVQPTEADLEAKETRLQLKLLGVMQSSVPEFGYAIIQYKNTAELYRVGDALPGGRNILLSRVLVDRVIIDNHGTFESLLLYDDNKGGAAAPVAAARPSSAEQRVVDHRADEEITSMAAQYRQQLLDDPMSLADVINISVAKGSGDEIIGYRVRPGRDRKQFSKLGLRSGDVITSVNGVPMNDPAQAMALYGQIKEMKEASVMVKRGNEEINLLLNLTE